jgi:hypothetical protein
VDRYPGFRQREKEPRVYIPKLHARQTVRLLNDQRQRGWERAGVYLVEDGLESGPVS